MAKRKYIRKKTEVNWDDKLLAGNGQPTEYKLFKTVQQSAPFIYGVGPTSVRRPKYWVNATGHDIGGVRRVKNPYVKKPDIKVVPPEPKTAVTLDQVYGLLLNVQEQLKKLEHVVISDATMIDTTKEEANVGTML